MDPVFLLLALWIGFAATHLVMSSRSLRPRLVAALGERGFQGVYSLIALALFVPLVTVYLRNRHSGAYLGSLAGVPGTHWIVLLGMTAALCLVVGGLARQSPASFMPGATEVRGVFHVTRHPLLMGVGLFGLLHLCAVAVHASELVFFAGFPIFVLIGCRHQDQRKLASGDDAFRRFHAATPFLPFSRPAGVVRALREQPLPIALGIASAVALRWLHGVWFR